MTHPPAPTGDWIQATVAQRREDAWTAITDSGAEISVPDGVVTGFRFLRPGQRLMLRLARPDGQTAEEAAPLSDR